MIVYSKFSSVRRKEFQLFTTIEQRPQSLVVSKQASCPEALPFLYSMIDKYKRLKEENLPFTLIQPYRSDKDKLSFQFVITDSLDYRLQQTLIAKKRSEFLTQVHEYCKVIRSMPSELSSPSPEFQAIFGNSINFPLPSSKAGCLDLNFDNIFVSGDTHTLIDYEWCFPFSLPLDFIIFRALSGFYLSNRSYRPNSLVPFEELLKEVDINSEWIEPFLHSEAVFQKYVCHITTPDEDNEEIRKQYKKICNDDPLINYSNRLVALNAYILLLESEAGKRNSWIQKLEESIQAKDSWIAKIEKDNSDLIKSTVELSNMVTSIQKPVEVTEDTDKDNDRELTRIHNMIEFLQTEAENKNVIILNLEEKLREKVELSRKLEANIQELSCALKEISEQISQFKPN